MCGIFAYLNYLVPTSRKQILEILINGLHRLEYRGYDSAGCAFDADVSQLGQNAQLMTLGSPSPIQIVRRRGKVQELEKQVQEVTKTNDLNMDATLVTHCGIAHTRWATHGEPSDVNSHPHRSDANNEFVVVHNGIITNYKDLKAYILKHNPNTVFESETDTEVIAKLIHTIYHSHEEKKPGLSFRELVDLTIQQLEGAYALIFKSVHYPGELVATRRGSPLLIGIRTASDEPVNDTVPVCFGSSNNAQLNLAHRMHDWKSQPGHGTPSNAGTPIQSPARLAAGNIAKSAVEFFFSSDASAIIEHTDRVIYLEDDDIACVTKLGKLEIYRPSQKPQDSLYREVTTLKMELQQIMKGNFSCFMQV